MKIYKHTWTGAKITGDTYNSLDWIEQQDYEYIGSTSGNSSTDSDLVSGIIGFALGAIVGNMFDDNDSSGGSSSSSDSFDGFGGGYFGGGGASGDW